MAIGSVVRGIMLLCIGLAGCAPGPQSSAARLPVAPAIPSAATVPAPSAAETPAALDDVLPVELGGVTLHTFAVGQDIVARLAAEVGVGPDDVEVRNASEHGARFLQMFALQAPGISGVQLLEAWPAAAYPADVTDATASPELIGGKPVIVVDAASARSRLGTFYAFSSGDTLLVVQALDPSVAEEALAALP